MQQIGDHPSINVLRENDVPISGKLSITVISGTDLAKHDLDGKSDPYCKFGLRSGANIITEFKTEVVKNSLDPIWNHTEVLELPNDCHDFHLVCYDWNKILEDTYMGEITLPVEDLLHNVPTTINPNLKSTKKSKTASGFIKLSYTYVNSQYEKTLSKLLQERIHQEELNKKAEEAKRAELEAQQKLEAAKRLKKEIEDDVEMLRGRFADASIHSYDVIMEGIHDIKNCDSLITQEIKRRFSEESLAEMNAGVLYVLLTNFSEPMLRALHNRKRQNLLSLLRQIDERNLRRSSEDLIFRILTRQTVAVTEESYLAKEDLDEGGFMSDLLIWFITPTFKEKSTTATEIYRFYLSDWKNWDELFKDPSHPPSIQGIKDPRRSNPKLLGHVKFMRGDEIEMNAAYCVVLSALIRGIDITFEVWRKRYFMEPIFLAYLDLLKYYTTLPRNEILVETLTSELGKFLISATSFLKFHATAAERLKEADKWYSNPQDWIDELKGKPGYADTPPTGTGAFFCKKNQSKQPKLFGCVMSPRQPGHRVVKTQTLHGPSYHHAPYYYPGSTGNHKLFGLF
eukprot:TRINITY_DN5663_c0_g1_i3.p1 TRINITY_DN5663_c0_g1~~TRINITY_DN5663_c0_g1_i3.p1  ORF type:complete len:569 (+),score=124.01 TRINITY_DN5663_c0_g1_i3:96-1802(+)